MGGSCGSIVGFERFLLPPAYSTLIQNLPPSGFVVVINIEDRRCDAIALYSGMDKPAHIPLRALTLEKINKYRNSLATDLRRHQLCTQDDQQVLQAFEEEDAPESARGFKVLHGSLQLTLVQVLEGLWTELVNPILTALNVQKFDPSSGGSPPRVWWCPTGTLSFLPIHAAGIYGGCDPEGTFDYSISSYIPTISVLADRVKNQGSFDATTSGLFLTSQPSAPGTPRIDGTTTEVRSIYQKAVEHGIRALKVEGSDLTIDVCLRHMEELSSVHFACHASQNADNPLASRFIFHNGSLDLSAISQRKLRNADLAFLSACQTSTGEERLSDEAVHLAAGMLAAGYRRVVATMWSIGDKHAPDVANDFYGYLWRRKAEGGYGSGFDACHSAEALHYAIQQLRGRLADNSDRTLLAWIPYVHFGFRRWRAPTIICGLFQFAVNG